MATFPGGIPSFTNPTSGDDLDDAVGGLTHSGQHGAVNDEIEAIATELGTNPSAGFSTVGARFTDIEGDVTTLTAGLADVVADVAALPGGDARIFDVVSYGALVDGSTNDTAAWQAAIDAAAAAGGGVVTSSLNGVSIISGALQDTGGANAQLLLPAVDYADSECVPIVITGLVPPAAVPSVIGSSPVPDNALVLKSTLSSGTGAVLGAYGPGGTFAGFTNVHLTLRNLSVRTVANPTNSALDLRKVACVDIDAVTVDANSFDIDGLTQPTTTTSYGVRLPASDNGASVKVGTLHVVGFYTGLECAEHTVGENVSIWGCNTAVEFDATNHASTFLRLMFVHCKYGLKFTGAHAVDVWQFDIEHAASGWNATTYDIDDASNYGKGFVRWWAVLEGVGSHNSFTVNSATGISTSRVGAAIGSGSGSLTVQDENSNVSTSVTQIDFQGAGVTATSGTGEVVVTIPGGTAYVYRDRLTAITGNTILTLGATPVANSPLVWVNGTIKWPTTDYTISSNVITFNSALTAGDIVAVQYHSAASSASASALSGASINIVDNFTAADSSSSLSSRSTSTGSYAWSVGAGTWGILSNRAYESAGAGQVNYATVNAGVSDCTVSATIQAATTTAYYGVCGRMNTATGDGYLIQINHGASTIEISKRTSGSLSILGSNASYTAVNGDVISLVMSGSSLIAKVNGVTKVTTTDSSYIANTKHGIWTYFNSPRFDDFSVQP